MRRRVDSRPRRQSLFRRTIPSSHWAHIGKRTSHEARLVEQYAREAEQQDQEVQIGRLPAMQACNTSAAGGCPELPVKRWIALCIP